MNHKEFIHKSCLKHAPFCSLVVKALGWQAICDHICICEQISHPNQEGVDINFWWEPRAGSHVCHAKKKKTGAFGMVIPPAWIRLIYIYIHI